MKREDMKWPAEVSDEVIALTKLIKGTYPHARCYVNYKLNIEDCFAACAVFGVSTEDLLKLDISALSCVFIDFDGVPYEGVYVEGITDWDISDDACYSSCYEEVEV